MAAAVRPLPRGRRGSSLRVVYLLEDTGLWGGVKVVLQHADLLAGRGHQVTVVSPAGPPSWHRLQAGFAQVPALTPACLPPADVTVATYWTTIAAAAAAPAGVAVHYCQGYEGQITELAHHHAAIDEAYRTPIPCLAVSAHLAELITRRFARPCRVVTPSVSSAWRPRLRLAPHRPPRIVVLGQFELPLKGVRTALAAIRQLREEGLACDLVRISQGPLTAAETSVLAADEYHHLISPGQVATLFRNADLLLAPSWEPEGFGLPVLEALASGLPVVASDISSFRGFASQAAALVHPDDAAAFARAAAAILEHAPHWRSLRRRARAVARRFRPAVVATALENALAWVAGRQWAAEISPPGHAR
ncbi:MAG: glycosyltransferase [Acidobacteriota bacterium]